VTTAAAVATPPPCATAATPFAPQSRFPDNTTASDGRGLEFLTGAEVPGPGPAAGQFPTPVDLFLIFISVKEIKKNHS